MDMEKPASPSSDQNTATATVENQYFVSPPPSPLQYYNHQDLTTDFSSMYNFIFSPKSTLPQSLSITPNSSCSSSDDLKLASPDINVAAAATENRLNQARLILEYQQLCDNFDLCFSRLQTLKGEIEALRRENSDLLVANTELIKLLSFSSSRAAMNHRNLQYAKLLDLNEKIRERGKKNSPTSKNHLSFRSSSHIKPPVYVPSTTKNEEKAVEMEVYNQGMIKTEICNKWQETGMCPYGDHCQFAHGIAELRPVIRHPRYKTQICRMVLAGETCPYGHRCHFRHSLTEKEKLLISP